MFKNILININVREKVGVVGCIGVGKFFLVFVLFWMLELVGNIYIDGLVLSEFNV